jgi:hypothetical protein
MFEVKILCFIIAQCNRTYSVVANEINFSNLRSIQLGDLDNDKKFDIVVADASSDKVHVMFNNGDGTFTIQTLPPNNVFRPISIAITDVNNDKEHDILVLYDRNTAVIIFLNDGKRTFTEFMNYRSYTVPTILIAADVNNDGYPDIIIARKGWEGVIVRMNNGNGTFSQNVTMYDTLCGPHFATVADLNLLDPGVFKLKTSRTKRIFFLSFVSIDS